MLFLVALHITLIALTNLLVQFPFTLFGYHTTWGAFSYPLIFIVTDLTIRLHNSKKAQQVILFAMIPGLFISYITANLVEHDGFYTVLSWNMMAFRVAIASFCAYVIGQLIDILIFQKLRTKIQWWLAPSASSLVGNTADTLLFFFLAFYHSSNSFFAAHWPEIAAIDLCFKLTISYLTLIPVYGLVLEWLQAKDTQFLTES